MLRATFLNVLCLSYIAIAHAAPTGISHPISQAIDHLLKEESKHTGWQYTWQTNQALDRTVPPPCKKPIAVAQTAKLWGQTTVLLSCPEFNQWKSYLNIYIEVSGRYPVAAQTLAPGQLLNHQDISFEEGALTQLPRAVIFDEQKLVGMNVTNRIQAGQPFRSDNVRAPVLIQPGQMVRVQIKGNGFNIAGEGRAIGQGVLGQNVGIKTHNGQIFNAVVRSHDSVEVNMQ